MRIKKILFGIMMVAALLILARPSISIADTYSGAWLPNDSDIFAIELTLTPETGSFYMYDWGNQDTDLLLFVDGRYNSTTGYFTQDGGDWWASLSLGATTLSLGDTQEFGFYFLDGTTNYFSYDLTATTPGEAYTLYDSNTDMTVAVSDAAPVPIPTSALLFGSGIIGFIATGRVRRRDS